MNNYIPGIDSGDEGVIDSFETTTSACPQAASGNLRIGPLSISVSCCRMSMANPAIGF
uniref:Uncharacterized protein n=1 Tax=Candidatus Kentrum sp. TC TaxID=2126339 RepID=A0A450Z6T9_9GAMM|nr:MAG: hypothetical protein BECKTC1821D_GA0114238_107915 [Candidatus Kentron sp. TC]